MNPVLGIDLGTTYSVVATLDEAGRAVVVPNQLGEETTPSVVYFESPRSILVGTAARNAAPVFPDRTVTLIKRQMGADRLWYFDGAEYTPESISALILRSLTAGAVGEPVRAVVTVPAYFGIRESEATQQACLLAGIEPLELVREPVAAAIHYGFSEDAGIGTTLVYDLGGGTFDATLLTIAGRLSVVATDGDTELGGADWDRRLVSFLLDRFVETTRPDTDPADDASFMTEVALAAERAKRALTRTTTYPVPLRLRGASATVTVSRDEFQDMTRDLLDRSLDCVRRLLSTAGAAGDGIDQVLLVGGSSRMPMVGRALGAEFGWRPRLHDPDLAVAKGAAIRAHQLLPLPIDDRNWPRGRGPAPVSGRRAAGAGARAAASVVPRSFGLLIADSFDPGGTRRFVQHVIHRNQALPVEGAEITVSTIVDDQPSVRIEVFEQAGAVESAEVADNRRVLDGELTGLPAGLPGGSPIRITLRLDLGGRLGLTAIEPRSGVELTLEACIEGVVDTATRRTIAGNLGLLTVRQ